jgi:hypothetical protein
MRLVTFDGKPVRRQAAVKVVTFNGCHRAIKSTRKIDDNRVEVEFWRQPGEIENAIVSQSVTDNAEKMIRVKYYGSEEAELVSPERWEEQKKDVLSTESRKAVIQHLTAS